MASIFLPAEQTRLVTICAHVDHGKTTLADSLIESNGLISERLAGTLRYLDSLEEEQRRGITIRASAIGLKHQYRSPKPKSEPLDLIVHLLDSPGHTDFSTEVSSSLQCCDGTLLVIDAVEGMCARTHQVLREAYTHQLVPVLVINKVDRLCTDLCLSPTEAYLRLRNLIESVNAASAAMLVSSQASDENDGKSTNEYLKSQKRRKGKLIGTAKPNNHQLQQTKKGNNDDEEVTEEEARWTFEPMKGNVVFASALFGWGFTVPSLGRSLFRGKILPIKPLVLKQYLFGDFRYSDGKVLKWKHDSGGNDEPLFAEFALRPIWEIYEGVAAAAVASGCGSELFADGRSAVAENYNAPTKKNKNEKKIKADTPGMEQVLNALQWGGTASRKLPSTQEELQRILQQTGSSNEESVLRSILRRYRPVSETVLDSVYEQCPSPFVASKDVRPRALAFNVNPESPPPKSFGRIQQVVSNCDRSPDAPVVAHVCKFMAADRSNVRDPGLEDSSDNIILGLARVLSGRLVTGNSYYAMGPKHTTSSPEPPQRQIRLYLLMGSSFVLVDEVPAGHLCAVSNLDDLQLKTATLCSRPDGLPLLGFDTGIRPLVKVNVESENAADTGALERGLVRLSLADAAVEVTMTAKGERILACLGEIHLEQSILDLEKVYCGKEMKLRISDPIVEFGETTDWFEDEHDFSAFFGRKSPPLRQVTIPPYNEEEGLEFAGRGRTRAVVSGRCAAISLRAVPLSANVYECLQERCIIEGAEDDLKQLGNAIGMKDSDQPEHVLERLCDSLCALDNSGNAIIESQSLISGATARGIATGLGEVHVPCDVESIRNENLEEEEETAGDSEAKERSDEYEVMRGLIQNGGFEQSVSPEDMRSVDDAAFQIWKNDMRGSVVAGFQLAVRAGPICEEPVRAILVVLEGVEIAVKPTDTDQLYKCAKPLSGGMVVAALRSGIRCAMLTRPCRLMESHLRLTLHSSLAGIGPLYSILSKRRGKVIEDSMVDGTDLLLITAALPHAESFGLAPELFRKSSGEVTAPELVFSHWDRLDQDPFWIPTSLEEREDFGEILQNGDVSTGIDNHALHYIRKVRERKGLLVDSSRTVIAAEKQRTLKR